MTEGSNRLPILAAEIRRAHADVQEAAKTAAEHAIEAGHKLIEAKKLSKHGEWIPWLKDHCALAERTAQLYMKLARSGHAAETVAALGLNGAAEALTLEYCFHQPLYDSDDETNREWWLYALYLAERLGFSPSGATLHIDWLGRKNFKSVNEWLTEGPKWMSTWGGKMDGEAIRSEFLAFRTACDGASIDELTAKLQAMPEPPAKPMRRKRKNATVAFLADAER